MEVEYVAPRDSLEAGLVAIWEEVLDVHPVGVHDNFFDLGGHSLLAVILMAKIQQHFGHGLPLIILFHDPTVEQLANILREEKQFLRQPAFGGILTPLFASVKRVFSFGNGRHNRRVHANTAPSTAFNKVSERLARVSPRLFFQNLSAYRVLLRDLKNVSPLIGMQPNGIRPPFFCVPGSVGSVFYLYHLARRLGADQPFYGLQAAGLDGKSKPVTRVEDMAVQYVDALRSVQLNGPYFLGGHSFGGYVAFEMAQQLRKQGQEVALLAIIDTIAPLPGSIQNVGTWDDAKLLTFLASLIGNLTGKELEISYDELRGLGPNEQMAYVKEWLKTINPLIPFVGEARIRGLLEVLKASVNAQYAPQELYPDQITLFRATNTHVQTEFGSIAPEIVNDPTLGWSHLSTKPVRLCHVSGDHVTLLAEPHAQFLADQLRACIDEALKL